MIFKNVFQCIDCYKRNSINFRTGCVDARHGNFYFCSQCSESFPNPVVLKEHRRKAHKVARTFQCEECNKSFSGLRYLIEHRRIHHKEDTPFCCSECTKLFSSFSNLNDHKRTHHPKTKASRTCCQCGKLFSFKCHLEKHMRVHTREKLFLCSECGKSFSKSGNLKKHMKRHTKKSSWGCALEHSGVFVYYYCMYISCIFFLIGFDWFLPPGPPCLSCSLLLSALLLCPCSSPLGHHASPAPCCYPLSSSAPVLVKPTLNDIIFTTAKSEKFALHITGFYTNITFPCIIKI